MRWII